MNQKITNQRMFVEQWLERKIQENPASSIIKAIHSATKNNQLNEIELLGALRNHINQIGEKNNDGYQTH